jgi:hypothetical protein
MTDRDDDMRELVKSLGPDWRRVSAQVYRGILDTSVEGVKSVTEELLQGLLAGFRTVELDRLGAVPLNQEAQAFARDLADRVGMIHAREDPAHSGLGDPLDLLLEVKLRGEGRRPLNEALYASIRDERTQTDVERLGETVSRITGIPQV